MNVEIIAPAPILNTPDFKFAFGGKSGSEIPLNAKQHPYSFEFVALQGMVFQVEEDLKTVYRISCPWYKSSHLYVDCRFTRPTTFHYAPPSIPKGEVILKFMIEKIGTPYVWGGNWNQGVPETLQYFPPKTPIDPKTKILWTLQGLDCSGLLFEATKGATPRNTSELVHFGIPVKRETPLQPLDMIVYPGHVLFILDENHIIESKFPFGVIIRSQFERIKELENERKRVNFWQNSL
ncbi:MAG: NlpC/P60 family protein, partial [Chlamydiae bacterium]|nr:NlpC/P60 family protein [Chlamydiota bacterium]